MSNKLFYIFLFQPFLILAQPIMHKGVFYRDDEGEKSGFLADKVSEIQSQLNYLKDNGVFVNVLLMTKECPMLEQVAVGNSIYLKGPSYVNNGEESALWGGLNTETYVFQILPRQARLYFPYSQGNSFWSDAGADFDYPLLLHNDKYYCVVKNALNHMCAIKGLNVSEPVIDCIDGDPVGVKNAIEILPQPYLNRNITDIADLEVKQVVAKTNFCTNLFYYGPYLHTRSAINDLREILVNSIQDGFILVTALPTEGPGETVFSDILLDISIGQGEPDNCYPTFRELSEYDRIEILHKLHGGNNSGGASNLENVKQGSDYLLERLLSSAQTPIPGNTDCGYGAYSGNGFNPADYNFVSDPTLEFYGTALSTPISNGYVKYYNEFGDSPDGILTDCTQSAIDAQESGLSLQYKIASGCTPFTPQFVQSRSDFDQSNPYGPSAIVWMYYDECDHRLYYDVKIPSDFASGINPGYLISNPDSIAALSAFVERIVEDIYKEAATFTSYQNANLENGEYPENMHEESLLPFFGEGTSCEGESPWVFGIRDGHEFTAPKLGGECLTVLWEIITDQSIPQRLWHPQPSSPCMLDMPGAAAGIIDGCLNLVNGKVWNLTGLLSASVDFYKADANTRKEVLKSISNPLNLILGQYPQNFECVNSAECQEERIYCFSNLSTNAIFDIFGGAILGAVGNISNIGAVVDDKLKMFVPNFDDKYNVWKRALSEGIQQKLHIFMEGISESAKFKLAKRVSLNKIWQKFDSGELTGITKEQLTSFIERLPDHEHKKFYDKFDEVFTNNLGEIADPNKVKAFIEDVNNLEPDKFLHVFEEFPEKYFRAWDISNTAGKVHLRKNIGFLNTIEEFHDGTISQKYQAHGCTLMDEAVIRHYTGEYHSPLNMALVGANPMTEEYLEFKDALNQGLNKLPDYNGVVYRGLGGFESGLARQWVVGQTIDNASWDKKFVSTTIDPTVADGFRKNYFGDVIVKISPCKTGKHIEEVSKFNKESNNEMEVLYGTGKKYKVLSMEPQEGNPNVLEISIEEI